MTITNEITLSVTERGVMTPLFEAVQGEADTRIIKASLTSDGSSYSPGSGVTAELWCRKSDATGTQHSATLSGSTVTATLTEQDLAAAGVVYCTIVLKSGTSVLCAMPFTFLVRPIAAGDAVDSTSEYSILTDATAAAESATAAAKAATTAATAAAESAAAATAEATAAAEDAREAAADIREDQKFMLTLNSDGSVTLTYDDGED